MKDFRKEKVNYNYKKILRFFGYGVLTVLGIVFLTGVLNIIFLISAAVAYVNTDSSYIQGGKVMEALTPTESGYELDGKMAEEFERQDQWAMLLDQTGQVIWSIRKPEELEDQYTQSDIARMSKWYLKGYPVQMRAWDDRIMIVGMQKEMMWKYNIEFSISWMDFVKRTFWVFFFINFVWIVVLAFIFTRCFTKKRERARIEWIAGISHDIRTPLSMVMGYSDTLEHAEELPEEARQQASVIRHQSVVMKELISDLNLTSQLEYSMQTLRKEETRPAEIVRAVAVSFLNDAMPGMLEIEMEIDESVEQMVVKADRQLLVRAFRNLINNSVKHGGQADTVKIKISLWEEKRKCYIRFQDNGVGYSEEVLRRLQGRKKEGDAENIRGLEIVRKIILAHGGKIGFGNCEEGGGYCVILFPNRLK